jgi:long-chain acyl-CoA synthetase
MPRLQDLCAEALARATDRPAIRFEGHWHTWGDCARVAGELGAALDAATDAPGTTVVLVARNRPAAIAALLGLLSRGHSVQMVYPFQSGEGVARYMDGFLPAAVVADAQDFAPEVRAALTAHGIAAIALDGMAAAALTGFEHSTNCHRLPGEPRIEILTSGTTGPPKSFPIPFAMLETHFLSTPLTRAQGADPESLPPFLLYFPLGNISGVYSTLPTLLRGQRVELLERFSIAAWRDYVMRWQPVHSGLPPSFVQAVLDADIPREELASIRVLGVGAAPLDPAVQAAFEDRYGIPILVSYGATEFAGPVAMMTAELHPTFGRAKLGTVGRALPGAKLRVVDRATGAPLPAGEEGLLEVVSPRIGPDWIRTADLAVIDADAFLFLRGRADGAIMRGGFKVLPETIERALVLHPAVAEAGVVGVPDARLGAVPAAALVLRTDVAPTTFAELEAHLRRHVLATHIPVHWQIVAELPRTPSLKIDRAALKSLLAND